MRAIPFKRSLLIGAVLTLIQGGTLAALELMVPRIEGVSSYKVELEPERPIVGETWSLRVLITDLGGASLASSRLGEGLSLVSSSSRALISEKGERGSEILLELAATKAGTVRVEELAFEGREGRLRIGPLEIPLLGGEGPQAASWNWVHPKTVTEYQSFVLSLETRDQVPAGAWPSFALPERLFLEAGPTAFSWVATALGAGPVVLPPVEIRAPSADVPRGRAAASELRVSELPPALAASRAIGDFSLSIEGPKEAVVGRTLEIRIKLSGRGNLPSLRPPILLPSFDGMELPPGAWTERREEAIKVEVSSGGGGYRGSLSLVLSYLPARPGLLSLRLSPYRVMDGQGRQGTLEAKAFSLKVVAGEGKITGLGGVDSGTTVTGGDGKLSGLATGQMTVTAPGGKATVPQGGASVTVPRAGSTVPQGKPSVTVPGGGAKLAVLYHQARVQDRHLRGEARRLAGELGLPPPDFGPWPPPLPLALASGLSLFLYFAFLYFQGRLSLKAPFSLRRLSLEPSAERLSPEPLAGRLSPEPLAGRLSPEPLAGRLSPNTLAKRLSPNTLLPALALTLTLLFAGAAVAAAIDQGRARALVWSDHLLAIPSAESQSSLSEVRGASGRVLGKSGGWTCLLLRDGRSGWLPDEAVYFW